MQDDMKFHKLDLNEKLSNLCVVQHGYVLVKLPRISMLNFLKNISHVMCSQLHLFVYDGSSTFLPNYDTSIDQNRLHKLNGVYSLNFSFESNVHFDACIHLWVETWLLKM
jgi:hypothetical protein